VCPVDFLQVHRFPIQPKDKKVGWIGYTKLVCMCPSTEVAWISQSLSIITNIP